MVSKRVQGLSPYTAGEQPKDGNLIKLNTNENPYGVGEKVLRVLRDFDSDRLRLYPDPDAVNLKKLIASVEGVCEENVFLGNGSDEVLAFAFYALFDKNVAFADVTYSFYPVYCKLYDLSYKIIPLKDDFILDPDDYINNTLGGIVIANPNAPTSLLLDKNEVRRIIENNKCNIIVDEAYIDFAPENSSVAALCKEYPNLLTVKTFSKSYSLAGIRCGYAIGSRELINALNKVKNSFNSYPLDAICQEVCAAALTDTTHHKSCCNQIITTRNKTAAALKSLGCTVLSSNSNFLFISPPNKGVNDKIKTANCKTQKDLNYIKNQETLNNGQEISIGKSFYNFLRQYKILVRHWNTPERIQNFVRISIGNENDMQIFVDKTREFISLY